PKLYGRKFGELSDVRAKRDFAFGARQLLEKGLNMSPDKPFRIMGDVGELHILPPKYAYEVRNNEQLSFTMAAFKWFYAHLPGFEGFREGTNESHIMKLVARHQLTHQLTLVTGAVSEECALVLKDVYTDSPGMIHALLASESTTKPASQNGTTSPPKMQT
ncbi:unnamed protein product, partial [Fusarium graminearum]